MHHSERRIDEVVGSRDGVGNVGVGGDASCASNGDLGEPREMDGLQKEKDKVGKLEAEALSVVCCVVRGRAPLVVLLLVVKRNQADPRHHPQLKHRKSCPLLAAEKGRGGITVLKSTKESEREAGDIEMQDGTGRR